MLTSSRCSYEHSGKPEGWISRRRPIGVQQIDRGCRVVSPPELIVGYLVLAKKNAAIVEGRWPSDAIRSKGCSRRDASIGEVKYHRPIAFRIRLNRSPVSAISMASAAVIAELLHNSRARERRAGVRERARAVSVTIVIEKWLHLPPENRAGSTIPRVESGVQETAHVLHSSGDVRTCRVDGVISARLVSVCWEDVVARRAYHDS